MIVKQTEIFAKWFAKLRDIKAKTHIAVRIRRIEKDNFFGDCKSVGDEVFELRINCGAGYRVYFTNDGEKVVILLCGGDKGSQKRDIERAKSLIQ